ncbi:hypothetical protein GL4_2936 [Methyloceanibacter caenitepidi]|uniref:Uncharacterized protein n=1 Tax=Methyloceanibacter caenitepidi TaxID=1384459 RepID=A0A0A8K628_9HYPH|nr:hypothetical protein GL4_2936 [Methyloceanibacter caenitepidi]
MSAICPAGPPNDVTPIFVHTGRASLNDGEGARFAGALGMSPGLLFIHSSFGSS